jgi:hypothetical protein
MTQGLLVSRLNKFKLAKNAVHNPTVYNVQKFKDYRNLYNTVIYRTSATFSTFSDFLKTKQFFSTLFI